MSNLAVQGNAQGGYDPTDRAGLARARAADLVTLPARVKGTNCSNCAYVRIQPAESVLPFCAHPRVQLPVTARMCCALWDAPGTLRAWVP